MELTGRANCTDVATAAGLAPAGGRYTLADAYDRHANTFLSKPGPFRAFATLVRSLEAYWFDAAELPAPVEARP